MVNNWSGACARAEILGTLLVCERGLSDLEREFMILADDEAMLWELPALIPDDETGFVTAICLYSTYQGDQLLEVG